jgi:hypothetical protein
MDAEHRAAHPPLVGDIGRADRLEPHGKVPDELQHRAFDVVRIALTIVREPVTVVVPLEIAQEFEERGREVAGHGVVSLPSGTLARPLRGPAAAVPDTAWGFAIAQISPKEIPIGG